MSEQTLDDIQPVTASEGGKNSHIIACETIGQRRYYAVCLKLANEKKPSQALQSIYSECFAAINKRTCPALKMQKEEIAVGHALYFQERPTEPVAIIPILKGRRKISIEAQAPVEPPKVKKDNNVLGFNAPSYADALNKVIERESKETKTDTRINHITKPGANLFSELGFEKKEAENLRQASQSQINKAANPNESLLDLAKRLMAQKSN